MSMHRDIQKIRLSSSAPTNRSHHKHVHFREVHSEEPKQRDTYQENTLHATRRNEQLSLEETENSFLPFNSNYCSPTTSYTPSSISTTRSHSFYRLPDDLLARGDFIAYQDANVSDFFDTTSPTQPKRVSEICLVNDHYILVKIPDSKFGLTTAMDPIAEEGSSALDNSAQSKGFLRYFPCRRNGRVQPTANTLEAKTTNPTADKTQPILKCPFAHCWRVNENREVFNTRTKVFGVFWKQKVPGKVITMQPSKQDMSQPLDLRNKSVTTTKNGTSTVENNNKIDAGVFGTPLNTSTKVLPKESIFGGKLQTSLSEAVALEQHAAWVNDERSDLKQILTRENPKTNVEGQIRKSKKRANVFRWFFKHPKTTKPKSKIHAVVYKTYFVRWKKPPEELCPHCGRSRNEEMREAATCKWKRCRSATF
ncbi:unnamed protein product [Ceratitis capitata]|uniref:(Mediterranean fruit fly) hypothetical protein n=1 Tax=Ceratitis capitata TaxID=7213 RepID=W8AGR6_CERCA|nr:unnamed protein product [Ceratitis capitata]